MHAASAGSRLLSVRRAAVAINSAATRRLSGLAKQLSAPQTRAFGSSPMGTDQPSLQVERVFCLSDNFAWLLHDPVSKLTTVVDPSEAGPVEKELTARGWALNYIWNTHHHFDHTGGNLELKKAHAGLKIIGPKADESRIPGIDEAVGDGDTFQMGGVEVKVFDTPGHTRGHISFWVPSAQALFPGDTLFALGCGRLFEGNPQQMWTSLSKLTPLPDNTRVFCAHEYTQSNARFAVVVDPTNEALRARKEEIDNLRAQNIPTVPSLLGLEKATNPFLRPHDKELRKQLGVPAGAEDWEAFAAVRLAKDNFRG